MISFSNFIEFLLQYTSDKHKEMFCLNYASVLMQRWKISKHNIRAILRVMMKIRQKTRKAGWWQGMGEK